MSRSIMAVAAMSSPNLAPREDTTVAVGILDRLLHHATVLQIDGDSYRMRGHRARLAQLRAGLNH